MVRLEEWSVVYPAGSLYQPNEILTVSLRGRAYGHPRFEDGDVIETSTVTGSSVPTPDGHVVPTRSRQYLLGAPSQDWLEWMVRHGIPFDPEQPVKFTPASDEA